MTIPRKSMRERVRRRGRNQMGRSNGITIYEPKEIECRKAETKSYIQKKREEKGGKVKRKKRKSVIGLRDTGNYSVRREKLRTESEREIG